MPYVLTVDGIDSRQRGDRVGEALDLLADLPTLSGFSRTVGDEFQGVLDDELSVVTAMLRLMRGDWHIGLGVGAVDAPLPSDPREGSGPAFIAAREAVERAKSHDSHVAVEATPARPSAQDVETVLRLVAELRTHRTDAGWEVSDLADLGLTQQAVADRLGISRQAVGQRLRTASWAMEGPARITAARLLGRISEPT